MNYKIQRSDYNQQIDQPLGSTNNYGNYDNYGIPVRDRLTDIFAYFPSSEKIYTGIPGQSNDDDDININNDGDNILDEPDRKNKKIMSNILNTLNKSNLRPEEAEFIYAEILDSQALMAINNFKNIISNPYLNMKINHIDKLERIYGCKIINTTSKTKIKSRDFKIKKRIDKRLREIYLQSSSSDFIKSKTLVQPLTDYKFYLKRIIDHKIEIPDRFDISYAEPYNMNNSYLPIKIMARFYKRSTYTNSKKLININSDNLLDTMSMTLIDLHSVRSKTMFAFHISKPSKRDGIMVCDQFSFSLNTAIHNSSLSQYLINYGTTKNYNIYTINNPLHAMIYHISYALLEPDLCRMMFYSVRHILDMIEIMVEYIEEIKKTLIDISGIKESDLFAYSHSQTKKQTKKGSNPDSDNIDYLDTDLLNRIIHISDVLYCIKESYAIDNNIISECFKSLWPKLNLLGCEITGSDRLYLNIVNTLLDTKSNGITIYSPVFAIPETVVGYNLECKSNNSYILDPSKAYFEFIEINDEYFTNNKTDIKTKSFRNLGKNKLYELVVSSYHTDTVRMATGSIVRIDSYSDAVPIVIPICREIELIYSMSNTITKIITPENIDLLMLDLNLGVKEYCFRKDNTCYKFYVELDKSMYIKKRSNSDSDSDNIIYNVSPEVKNSRLLYRLERLLILDYDLDKNKLDKNKLDKNKKLSNKSITNIEVRVVNPETFSKIIEMRTVDTINVSRIRIARRIEDLHEISILKKEIIYQF